MWSLHNTHWLLWIGLYAFFALIKIIGATKRVKFPTLFVLNWWVDNDANSICNIVGATASVDWFISVLLKRAIILLSQYFVIINLTNPSLALVPFRVGLYLSLLTIKAIEEKWNGLFWLLLIKRSLFNNVRELWGYSNCFYRLIESVILYLARLISASFVKAKA